MIDVLIVDFLGVVVLVVLVFKGFIIIINSGGEIENLCKNVGCVIVILIVICIFIYLLVVVVVGINLLI